MYSFFKRNPSDVHDKRLVYCVRWKEQCNLALYMHRAIGQCFFRVHFFLRDCVVILFQLAWSSHINVDVFFFFFCFFFLDNFFFFFFFCDWLRDNIWFCIQVIAFDFSCNGGKLHAIQFCIFLYLPFFYFIWGFLLWWML